MRATTPIRLRHEMVVSVKVTLGRRERRKQETRSALETAALRLFAERGYEQTTVEDIAEAADVAVRTFFRYFSSKQHVLFGDVAHTIVDRLRAALADRPAGQSPVEAVRAAMDSVEVVDPDQQRGILERMRLLHQMPELLPTYLMVFQELHVVLAEFVADRTGQRAGDLYPQLVAGAATIAARTALGSVQVHGYTPAVLRSIRHEAYDALTAGLERLRP
jgi:TetR/AcrR family transcriptional regulator, regulator of mycofactocin system